MHRTAVNDRSGNFNRGEDDEGNHDKQFSDDVVDYSNQVEEIITWLFRKEEELQQRPHESLLQTASFNQILDEYSQHEKFMTELCEYCHTIMKCKEDGQEMRDDENLSDEDRDEVGIQMDAMMVCYEKLKILTTDRLKSLQKIIDECQRYRIEQLERWLSSMELKIASSNEIGPDFEAIKRQINNIEELKNELAQKQDFLNFISKVIIFDDVDSESLQIKRRSSESLDKRLESMNQRWTSVCKFVDVRSDKLRKAEAIWKLLYLEGPQLSTWLKRVENSLQEVSDAARNISDPLTEKAFISKLATRSERIDGEIKSKQTFYTSLENRVRLEIEKFEDPCSMLVIELEKKLEDMQDNWNTIMRHKRMLDYKLQALIYPTPINQESIRSIIPIPDPITSCSNNDLSLNNCSVDVERTSNKNNGNSSSILTPPADGCEASYNEFLTNDSISSSGQGDKESSLQLNGSSSSDPKGLESSLSSGTKSLLYGTNGNHEHSGLGLSNLNDNESQEDGPSTTANIMRTTIRSESFAADTDDDISYSCSRALNFYQLDDNPQQLTVDHQYQVNLLLDNMETSGGQHHHHQHIDDEESHAEGTNSCRVEAWKHSLESFSNWLKQVEISLGMDCENPMDHPQSKNFKTWSQLDLNDQITLIGDVENRIETSCQDEFDCLFLQGQQIIEDLIPEIGDNDYEANLKEILADIEIRYGAIKRCLLDRRSEIADKEKWRKLVRNMRDSSDHIISKMTEVIPETNIGVDLITLAQQQDLLVHLREEVENDNLIQGSFQEARKFLKICETLNQQQKLQQQRQHQLQENSHDQQQPLLAAAAATTTVENNNRERSNLKDEIWLSFEEFRELVEDQLDKLTLHYSELSQIIGDRLERLNQVHKEMHSLQHKIQETATQLQVAEILKSSWVPLETLSIEQLSEQLEDLKLYRERLCETEVTHKIMNNIFDWMSQSGVPLSQSNLKRIDELNSIWESIQLAVEERQKSIEQAFDEQSGSEQKFLAQTVADLPKKWERRVATSKVPYFIDHDSNKTLWDHPKFTDILNEMSELKQYVYSVYRTAIKLRIVQRRLGVDMLMLEQLKEIFNMIDSNMKLQQQAGNNINNVNAGEPVLGNQSIQITSAAAAAATTATTPATNAVGEIQLGVEQIIFLLRAIFERIQSENETTNLDVPLAIDLTLNWLLNLFDSTRSGFVNALSLKVGLALMCCATREEKYIYMFELIANPLTGTVDARKLGTLFENCMRVPIYLGESESFGGPDLIETSIRNCFAMSKFNPQHPNCIDLSDYLNWLKTEPQFIIWLPVLHRILISENTVHQMKCKLCGANPIIGLRYRCLKCFKFNICQKCFLSGRHIYEHHDPAKHPMQEYCSKTSSGERVRDLTKILRNKLSRKPSNL